MHLTPSDPDIATLIRKIKSDRLDLQPNFQRGEVWGKPKKQRLIDSILRGWHIPPVHVIQSTKSEKQEVLDGQQRLAAIRDFFKGEFPINGNQEPLEEEIYKLDGLYWDDLSVSLKAKIEDFTIRVLTISDYKPEEPGELFYRLNQPTNLTSAEQRNAFFGEARQQVKNISEMMQKNGFKTETLGFSNSRMAYDDVIAKFLLTLEQKTLKKKVTANTVTARYRDTYGFDESLLSRAINSLEKLKMCLDGATEDVKLNKASTLSWLLFIDRFIKWFPEDDEDLVSFFSNFENQKKGLESFNSKVGDSENKSNEFVKRIFDFYIDRSSSRVADTSSVILRDLTSWIIFVLWGAGDKSDVTQLDRLQRGLVDLYNEESSNINEKNIELIGSYLEWGAEL
ncbi:DUF262 domain-containing protein [Methylophaga sp.]|uniref:DUF262 domain-containing protein n=1 Tax=Methylophaga sp. TaxID=2024840 RepID=UPI003A9499D7